MPLTSRTVLLPASFRGVPFHVEVDARGGGRRLVPNEFPKRNIPWTEDMGRRIRHWPVSAYILYSPVLDPQWQAHRDGLLSALEADGAGMLVLPTGLHIMNDEPPGMVMVDHYTVTEHREKAGYCEFQIEFIEAGRVIAGTASMLDTQGAVNSAAENAATNLTGSSDFAGNAIGSAGQFGIASTTTGAFPVGVGFGGGDTTSTTIVPGMNDSPAVSNEPPPPQGTVTIGPLQVQ
jgi:prophage DNA circulation protein